MPVLRFSVQGSSSTPYAVAVHLDEKGLIATCTCTAGTSGQSCKHRVGILVGPTPELIGGDDIETARAWFSASSLSSAYTEMIAAENAVETAKLKAKQSKAKFARALLGRVD